GYSGLGYGGVASRDPFTRPATIRTWKQGIKWATKKKTPKKKKGLFGMANTRFMRQSKNRKVKAGKKRVLPFRAKNGSSSLLDRKSTRLNSSHVSISYAVFCLRKKKTPHAAALTPHPR